MIRHIVLSLCASLVFAGSRPKKPEATQKTFMKPIFVFEMVNQAPAESEKELTLDGKSEAFKLGMKRKEEYAY